MASDLGLHCLPMSHKKDARLICVNSGVIEILFSHFSTKYMLWVLKNMLWVLFWASKTNVKTDGKENFPNFTLGNVNCLSGCM